MSRFEIEEALKNVQEIKLRVIDHQVFKGYSGVARILSGIAALISAFIMSRSIFPETVLFHLGGWAGLYLAAVLLNFGALFGRFLATSKGLFDWVQLRPVWNIVPSFLVAGLLSFHFARAEMFGSLFGMWMAMYGLMHLSSRHSLPKAMSHVGWFYVLCGAYFLIHVPSFFNPWPMGVVFFLGEIAGGIVFCQREKPVA